MSSARCEGVCDPLEVQTAFGVRIRSDGDHIEAYGQSREISSLLQQLPRSADDARLFAGIDALGAIPESRRAAQTYLDDE